MGILTKAADESHKFNSSCDDPSCPPQTLANELVWLNVAASSTYEQDSLEGGRINAASSVGSINHDVWRAAKANLSH